MDLTWSADEEAFRAEARAWLESEQPLRPHGAARRATPARASRAPRVGATAVRRPVGGRVVAGGVRRPRRVAVGVADLRGGVLPGRAARSGSRRTASSCWRRRVFEFGTPEQQDRILPRMAAAEDLWCQGWSEPNAGSDLAGIQQPGDEGRRRLGAQRPEDVDDTRRVLHAPVRAVPLRSRQRAPQGAHLLPRPARRRRRDRARLRSARRRRGLRRGVLRGRVRRRRRRARAGSTRAGRSRWRRTGSERGLTLRSPGRFLATADAAGRAASARRRTATSRRTGAPPIGSSPRWMQAEAYQLFTLETVTDAGRGRPGRRRVASTRSGGASSTSSCTRSRSTCSARTPSSTDRGARATSSRCPGPIYAGTNEIQRNIAAERVLGLPRSMMVRADRRPGRVPRRGARPAREASADRRRAAAWRRPAGPALATGAAVWARWSRWACSACRARGGRRARARRDRRSLLSSRRPATPRSRSRSSRRPMVAAPLGVGRRPGDRRRAWPAAPLVRLAPTGAGARRSACRRVACSRCDGCRGRPVDVPASSTRSTAARSHRPGSAERARRRLARDRAAVRPRRARDGGAARRSRRRRCST